ncbi:Uncharacterised protein [Mycobacteroides abscessus subsp. abscessus]|nr:Uncharacterised protein [Mycobacteroides abscessus subsp. abscessus]
MVSSVVPPMMGISKVHTMSSGSHTSRNSMSTRPPNPMSGIGYVAMVSRAPVRTDTRS